MVSRGICQEKGGEARGRGRDGDWSDSDVCPQEMEEGKTACLYIFFSALQFYYPRNKTQHCDDPSKDSHLYFLLQEKTYQQISIHPFNDIFACNDNITQLFQPQVNKRIIFRLIKTETILVQTQQASKYEHHSSLEVRINSGWPRRYSACIITSYSSSEMRLPMPCQEHIVMRLRHSYLGELWKENYRQPTASINRKRAEISLLKCLVTPQITGRSSGSHSLMSFSEATSQQFKDSRQRRRRQSLWQVCACCSSLPQRRMSESLTLTSSSKILRIAVSKRVNSSSSQLGWCWFLSLGLPLRCAVLCGVTAFPSMSCASL